ncbi:MAG: molybdopterin oxidoreductase, partial [Candidatus Tectomicrobia bacterium]|nr:molybdopterin oxidoreductase [Candidatus Tectomicrobia bacterium]
MTSPHLVPLDLEALGQRLAQKQGPEFWRSLDEVAQTPAFQTWVQNEFAPGAPEWHDPLSRRRFLQLMGASLGLAGLTACTRQPEEKIVPYIQAPEGLVPGKPLFFATAMPLGGVAHGVLVESHMGRPTKIEGNPQHPASLGATDALTQASILGLYDPDRSQSVTHVGRLSTWSAFLTALGPALETQRLNKGARLRLLTETVTSPTLGQQCQDVLTLFPQAKWYQYEPVTEDAVRAGLQLAFGEALQPVYHLEAADVIVALDADMLTSGPGNVRYARDFMRKRQMSGHQHSMNRLYVVESTPSLTGAMADHRLPLRPAAIAGLAHALMRALTGSATGSSEPAPTSLLTRWVQAMAGDLQQHRGKSLVLAGPQQPPVVHALAHTMNSLLGNIGQTVTYIAPTQVQPVDHTMSLMTLVQEIVSGAVEMLVILGGNPVYTAPANSQLAHHLTQVPLRIHLGLYHDETAALCHWHVPEAHYLETWSDARAYDGTVSVLQPLIAPLYGGKSAHELLA